MAQRILLTGASGFVGPLLGQAILQASPDATLLAVGGDRPSTIEGAENTFSLLETDADAERLAAFRPDIVVHLGGRSSVASAVGDAAGVMEANLAGSLRLARALRHRAPGAAFVFASSAEVYGHSFLSGPVDETSPPQPANPYARSKTAVELALTDMLGDQSAVVMLRLFNHTGPTQDERFVIPSFAAQIARIEAGLKTDPLRVGNLSAERDFLHVNDVIAAYLKVLARVRDLGRGAHVYNVCSSVARSIQSVLDALIAMARAPVRVELDPDRLRPSDIPFAVGSNERFRATFGWSPTISTEDTLRDVLDGWRRRVAS